MISNNDRNCGVVPDCSRVADAPAYVFGMLSADEEKSFCEHMGLCVSCSAEVAEARRTLARLMADVDDECPVEFADRIMADICRWDGAEPVSSGGPARLLPWLARAAALVLLLGVGVLIAVKQGREAAKPSAGAGVGQSVAREDLAAPVSALDKAQAWLVQAQEGDGRWSSAAPGETNSYDVGVSGLALMALMGCCSGDVMRGDAGKAMRAGMGFLVSRQGESGLFGPVFSGATYNHGLATLALLDACVLEDNPRWRTAADLGLRFIISVQDASGGWNYMRSNPGTVNSSASVWPLVALIRGKSAGFEGLHSAVQRGLRWMRGAINDDGLMGYHRMNEAPDGYDTLTAAGALCLLRGRSGADSLVLQSMLPKVRRLAEDTGQPVDFYRMFFISEALALVQDSIGDATVSMNSRLLAMQRQDGTAAGSWPASDRWGAIGGPVYATALAAMSLCNYPGGRVR